MSLNNVHAIALSVVLTAISSGCSSAQKSPDVTDAIRKDLNQPAFKDVSVRQDRDKGVVTLGGHVNSDADKAQAESIAKSNASGQVVADQIEVLPPTEQHDTNAANADIDKGIEKNLDAALIQNKLNHTVRYDVKNGVVTLKGQVNSEGARNRAESVASKVPNVQQVVNEIDLKNTKASSTK